MTSNQLTQMLTNELLLTVPEAARRLAVSRSTIYKLIRNGQLLSVKVAGARRIPTIALYDFFSDLLDEAATVDGIAFGEEDEEDHQEQELLKDSSGGRTEPF